MQFFFELNDETILELAADLMSRDEQQMEEIVRMRLKREISYLTRERPTTKEEADRALS
jgi:hypothetical protein